MAKSDTPFASGALTTVNQDLSSNGIVLNITSGAVLNTATFLRAWVFATTPLTIG